MSEDRKPLPATTVPVAGYELIRNYAFANRMSIGEAIRVLLTESPQLQAYAKKHGYEVDFEVEKRGGYRPKKEDKE